MREKVSIALYSICIPMIYVALLVGIVINGCGRVFGITEPGGWHWFLAILTILLLAWIHHGKANEKIISASILILCVFVIIPLIGAGQIADFQGNYFNWLMGQRAYDREWLLGYELMQTVLVVIGCYGVEMLVEKKQIIRDVLSLALLTGLLAGMFVEMKISHAGVVWTLCFILLCFIERTQMGWKKKKERDKQEYLLWLMPFCVVYMLLLFVMPVKEEPYDWQFVRSVYSNLKEKIIIWIEDMRRNGQEDFGISMSGFSEEASLLSSVIDIDRDLITIQGGHGLTTNVYLLGKSYDSFDGTEWVQTISHNTEEYPLDTLETIYAVERYDDAGIDNYIYKTELTLQYKFFHTGYLFTPLKLAKVEDAEYQIHGRDMKFGEQKGYSTNYALTYYQLNMDNPDLVEMMETVLPEDEDAWNSVVRYYSFGREKRYSLEELQQYRDSMEQHYYKEITLSEDVEQYVAEITGDCETDLEKLQAIEQELSGYVYTKTPRKLPQWIESQEDFLDFFLLESKEGYCSHFATAFVLLARAEGFPARYVEGFCVPITKDKRMTVSSSMSHAWPEVYIEGIGWIPFEPTPGYGELRHKGWKVKEVVERKEEGTGQSQIPETPIVEEPVMPEVEVQEEAENTGRLLVGGISMLVVAVVCLLILFAGRILWKRRYLRMTIEQQFVIQVKRNLWIFSKLGYKRADTETLSELQERICAAFPELLQEKEEFAFIGGYQEYLYGRLEVSEELLQETIAEREELLLWIKQASKRQYYMLVIRMLVVGI